MARVTNDSDPEPDEARVAARLDELATVTPRLPELPEDDVRRHVEAFRAFLHDDVLQHAQDQELHGGPAAEGLGRSTASGAVTAEHETLRDALGSLDDLSSGELTSARVQRLVGLMTAIEQIVATELEHQQQLSRQAASDTEAT